MGIFDTNDARADSRKRPKRIAKRLRKRNGFRRFRGPSLGRIIRADQLAHEFATTRLVPTIVFRASFPEDP